MWGELSSECGATYLRASCLQGNLGRVIFGASCLVSLCKQCLLINAY